MDAEADGTPAFQEAGPVLPSRVTRSAVKMAAAHQAVAAASAGKASVANVIVNWLIIPARLVEHLLAS